MDAASERYITSVSEAVAAILGTQLVGVYLHGSAVLGGFDSRGSDLDVLVVCDSALQSEAKNALAGALLEDVLPCPATGLELSVVTHQTTTHPIARPAYELHMTTAPEDPKVINGHGTEGDPDLVLHFAVCRAAGRVVSTGPPAHEVFAAVPETLVLDQLADELGWAAEHGSGEYAVLNICRAWRFANDRVVVSKIDGGHWALGHTPDSELQDLIRTALDRQQSVPTPATMNAATLDRFSRTVREQLVTQRDLGHPN